MFNNEIPDDIISPIPKPPLEIKRYHEFDNEADYVAHKNYVNKLENLQVRRENFARAIAELDLQITELNRMYVEYVNKQRISNEG